MAFAKIRIVFEPRSAEAHVYEKDLEMPGLREDGGQEFVAQQLFSELEKNANYGRYYAALPSTDNFLRQVRQTFRLDDLASGSFEDRSNARAMWSEIAHTLLRAKHLLAEARSYYDQEHIHLSSQGPEAENLSWTFHLDKIERFDHAVTLLGKTSDLAARLVFERLGASLLPKLDKGNPEWERALTWSNISGA
jgi:hypothetical protein